MSPACYPSYDDAHDGYEIVHVGHWPLTRCPKKDEIRAQMKALGRA